MIPPMRIRQWATTALLTAATVLLTATPAMAHAELIASDPAEGASVAAAPAQVRLTFNEPVTPAPNVLEVVGPGNATWTIGAPTVAGAVVTVPVQANGPTGAYTMVYRVVSGDGDAVTGNVTFTLAAAATTTTTPPPTTTTTTAAQPSPSPAAESAPADDDGGVPIWVWIVGAVVLVAVGVALRMGRAKS